MFLLWSFEAFRAQVRRSSHRGVSPTECKVTMPLRATFRFLHILADSFRFWSILSHFQAWFLRIIPALPVEVDAETPCNPRHDVGWKRLFAVGHAHRAEFPPIGAQPVVQRPCAHARTGCELLSCHCFHSFVFFVFGSLFSIRQCAACASSCSWLPPPVVGGKGYFAQEMRSFRLKADFNPFGGSFHIVCSLLSGRIQPQNRKSAMSIFAAFCASVAWSSSRRLTCIGCCIRSDASSATRSHAA